MSAPSDRTTATTLIKNADTIVAWDADAKTHVYLRNTDLVFTGARISFIGPSYDGTAETTIDGRGLMVMPGLVDIHSHPSTEPMNKGLIDELGSAGLYNSSL